MIMDSGEARDSEVGGFCKGRGSTRTGGLGDSVPSRVQGQSPGRGSGDEVPQKLKGFCNLCLKFVTFCDNKISFIHQAVRSRVKYCACPVQAISSKLTIIKPTV